ncbi:MAG: hypothetical protein ACRC6T_14800 [Sarcina sp.]
MNLESGTLATYITGFLGLGATVFFGIKSLKSRKEIEKVQEQKHKTVKHKNINQKMNSKGKSSSQKIVTKYTDGGDINQEMDI